MKDFALLYHNQQLTEILDWIEFHIGCSGEDAIFLLSWLGGANDA
jgi:hypothetical protein